MKGWIINPLSAEITLPGLGSLASVMVIDSPKAIGFSQRLPGGENKKYYPVIPVDPV